MNKPLWQERFLASLFQTARCNLSVSTLASLVVKPYGLYQDKVRWGGYATCPGDGSGGVYLYGFSLTIPQLWSGVQYISFDTFEVLSTATLSGPYGGYIFVTGERPQGAVTLSVSRNAGFTTTSWLPATTISIARAAPLNPWLPNRFFRIDEPSATAYSLVYANIGPNTNGVSVTLWVSGEIATERYVIQHGIYIPGSY